MILVFFLLNKIRTSDSFSKPKNFVILKQAAKGDIIMKKFSIIITLLILLNIFPHHAYADNLDLTADSAVLIEASTGEIIYEKNMNKKEYPASITKTITALLAIENSELTDTITFSEKAVFSIERNSSHLWMVPDEQITMEQGLYGLLLQSANDVANGIAEHVDGSIEAFAAHMTEKAKELGAKNTHFTNPHGLHNPEHYTTAYDMAMIAKACYQNPVFMQIIGTPKYIIPATNKNEKRTLFNQHKMLENPVWDPTYFYDGCLGGKTGFTDQAQHTLITYAKRDNMTLISVVLHTDKNNLYPDTKKLLDYGFEHKKLQTLVKKDDPIKQLPVLDQNDTEIGTTTIIAASDFNYVSDSSMGSKEIQKEIILPEKLITPVDQSLSVGNINYYIDNELIGTLPLYPTESFQLLPEELTPSMSQTNNRTIFTQPLLRLFIMFILLILLFSFAFFILYCIRKITG